MKAAVAIALLTLSCRPPSRAPAIDPRLSAQVPEDASALLGLDLTALRASPMYSKLPNPFGDARYVLIAIRGQELLIATLRADGTVEGNGAAARPARSPLLTDAEPLAARNPVWCVIRGGTVLPLQGNLANLNNLLRDVDMLTLAAQTGDRASVELVALCPSLEAAGRFEGSFRAVLVLTGMASNVQLRREEKRVSASLTVSAELLAPLFGQSRGR